MDEALTRARENGDDTSEWRVDELATRDGQIVGFDEVDAVPMAFPVLETQGRNMFPLMDFDLIKKTMDREVPMATVALRKAFGRRAKIAR